MPNAELGFTEGAPVVVVDNTQLVAVIGYCSGAIPGTPLAPNVLAIDDPNIINGAAGYGPGPELAFAISSLSKKRCLLVPCLASIAAVLSAVTQTGTGPIVTCAAASSAPFDDAPCVVKIKKTGAPGTGTYQLAYSYSVVRGQASLLYQPEQTIPPRLAATAIGTINLASLTYATPGTVTGTVDLSTLTYGTGGDLDGLTLILDVDGGGATTTTFSAPASMIQVAEQINTAMGDDVASVNLQNKLVLASTTIGASSTCNVTGGTGLTALGLSVATHTGTAGDLDGETLDLEADTGGAHTITFTPPPADAADVASAVDATADVGADLYTASNYLRITSDTIGSSSSLNITGGSALTILGLAVPSSPYTGAEATLYVPHLGITWTFSSGTYKPNTTYAVQCTAGKPDLTEIQKQIDSTYAAQYEPFEFVIATESADAVASLAIAQGMATKVAAVQAQQEYPHVLLGAPVAESDATVKSTFLAFRSAWVDMAARGAYCRVSLNIPGGGNALRSQSWAAAVLDAAQPYHTDRGNHMQEPNILSSYVDGVTANEMTATTKLVQPVNGTGMSFNVIDGKPGNYRFAGGYTSADGTSKYVDSSTRNVVQYGAQIAQGVLNQSVNRTDLSTNNDGTLDAQSADTIDGAVSGTLQDALVPDAAKAVSATVDRTIDYDMLKKLACTITIDKSPPARTVTGLIGPGKVTATIGNGAIALS